MIAINGSSTKAMSIGPNEFELFVKSNYALRPDIYSGIFITAPNPIIKKTRLINSNRICLELESSKSASGV